MLLDEIRFNNYPIARIDPDAAKIRLLFEYEYLFHRSNLHFLEFCLSLKFPLKDFACFHQGMSTVLHPGTWRDSVQPPEDCLRLLIQIPSLVAKLSGTFRRPS